MDSYHASFCGGPADDTEHEIHNSWIRDIVEFAVPPPPITKWDLSEEADVMAPIAQVALYRLRTAGLLPRPWAVYDYWHTPE